MAEPVLIFLRKGIYAEVIHENTSEHRWTKMKTS